MLKKFYYKVFHGYLLRLVEWFLEHDFSHMSHCWIDNHVSSGHVIIDSLYDYGFLNSKQRYLYTIDLIFRRRISSKYRFSRDYNNHPEWCGLFPSSIRGVAPSGW